LTGPNNSALARRKVLFVDDDAEARQLTGIVLRAHGADVTTVSSGAEALEAMRKERFDALVSDLAMPGLDGIELMRAIRQLPPELGGDIAAIAVTGHSTPSVRRTALDAGFDWHVAKPVAALTLIDLIDGVILGKRMPD
jgi:CheY-like chemotaxis protein